MAKLRIPSTGLFRCQMAPCSGLGVGEPASFGLTKNAKSSSARLYSVEEAMEPL